MLDGKKLIYTQQEIMNFSDEEIEDFFYAKMGTNSDLIPLYTITNLSKQDKKVLYGDYKNYRCRNDDNLNCITSQIFKHKRYMLATVLNIQEPQTSKEIAKTINEAIKRSDLESTFQKIVKNAFKVEGFKESIEIRINKMMSKLEEEIGSIKIKDLSSKLIIDLKKFSSSIKSVFGESK